MDPSSPSRLLLASCHSQHYEYTEGDDDVWDAMSQRHAAGLLWVGDAVYGDDYHANGTVRIATPEILQSLYHDLLQTHPGYAAYRAAGPTILGVWDDHDYGVNNGDRNYPFRVESAELYLDFIRRSNRKALHDDWTVMERRARAGRGLYGVKVFDFHRPRGEELLSDHEAGIDPDIVGADSTAKLSDRSVAVFLMDCRSNKSPWQKDFPYKFQLDYDGDFFGDEQWQWLEAALQRSTATVNIILQGL